MVVGGIVLCGGQSRRMGRDKATLPFGDEMLLQRVVRLLGGAVERCVVVAAVGQLLPPLPPEVSVIRDRATGRGPLEGLYCGLAALGSRVEAAYVTACDAPFLRPEFVQRMAQLLGDHDVVVPTDGAFHHPLAAVYRTRLVASIAALLAQGERRMISFHDSVSTRRVDIRELRDVDPELLSLLNVNRPEDYTLALRRAGLPAWPGTGP